MRPSLLSRRYARALAETAEAQGMLERARAELNALAEAQSEGGGLQVRLRAFGQSREENAGLIRRLCAELDLSPPTAGLLEYLVRKRRLRILPELAAGYSAEADRRLGVLRATVTSALPLGEGQKRDIVARLQQITGARVEVSEQTDESLIAGFQVRAGGAFYDGSLRGRLERIKETITHGE